MLKTLIFIVFITWVGYDDHGVHSNSKEGLKINQGRGYWTTAKPVLSKSDAELEVFKYEYQLGVEVKSCKLIVVDPETCELKVEQITRYKKASNSK